MRDAIKKGGIKTEVVETIKESLWFEPSDSPSFRIVVVIDANVPT